MKQLFVFLLLFASPSIAAAEKATLITRIENEKWIAYQQTIKQGAEIYCTACTYSKKTKKYCATIKDAKDRWHKHPLAAQAQLAFQQLEKLYQEQNTTTKPEENKTNSKEAS